MTALTERKEPEVEIQRLRALVVKGLEVVEDFMPNIGSCALQDYGRLNEFMIAATRERLGNRNTEGERAC